jgi:two-component SAPR family response regulator
MQPLTKNDVIFIDIELAQMSGIDFLERLNKIIKKQDERPRVFIVSGSLDPFAINKSQKYSFVEDFIPKPIFDDDLRIIMQ